MPMNQSIPFVPALAPSCSEDGIEPGVLASAPLVAIARIHAGLRDTGDVLARPGPCARAGTSTSIRVSGSAPAPAPGGRATCCTRMDAGWFAVSQRPRWRPGRLSFVLAGWRDWRGAPQASCSWRCCWPPPLVGGLKAVTNVDCPWDLCGFWRRQPLCRAVRGSSRNLPRAVFPRRARLVRDSR